MNNDEGLINTDLKSASIMIISVICVLSFSKGIPLHLNKGEIKINEIHK